MPADVSELLALAATLERSSARLGRDGAQVVRKEAEKVKQNMQASAPVGATKKLRDSIKVDGAVGSGRSGSMSVTITAHERYAEFQEYGTARHGPQPFAAPAKAAAEGSFPPALEKLAADSMDL